MVAHYEGTSVTSSIKADAREIIRSTKYEGEKHKNNLDDYIRRFTEAYNDLADIGKPVDEEDQVEFFLRNILDDNLRPVIESLKLLGIHKTFPTVSHYILTRAAELGLVQGSSNIHRRSDRRISAETRNHHNNSGRGKPPGRDNHQGGRGGRGGRGGHGGRGGQGGHGHSKPVKRYENYVPYRQFKAMSPDARDALIRARPKDNSKKRQVETSANRSLMHPDDRAHLRNASSSTVQFEDNDSSDDNDDDGAGNSFGRVGTQQHHTTNRQASKAKRARRTDRTIRGFTSSERHDFVPAVASAPRMVAQLSTTNATATGRFAYDAHADTCCIGKGWTILEKTGQVCTVHGFSDSLPPLTEVPVVTAATAYYDAASQATYVLIVHQALDLGPQQDGSLICPNQLRMHGIITDDIPRHLSKGTSTFGMQVEPELVFPYKLDGTIAYIDIRSPTEQELSACEHIVLTSPVSWNPHSQTLQAREEAYDARHIRAATTHPRKLQIPMDLIKKNLGFISQPTLDLTLAATTQLVSHDGTMPLYKRYKTQQLALKYRRLPHVKLYSDTLKGAEPSAFGHKYSQAFVTDFNLSMHYPMRKKSEAPAALHQWIQKYGIPGTIITDNAKEETLGEWKRMCRQILIEQASTEPHTPQQDRCEREILDCKRMWSSIKTAYQVPASLWDYGLEYIGELRSHIAHPLPALQGRTPIELATGDTPDISHFLYFHFYQPVYYWEPANFPEAKEHIGRWLGPAHNVGQALCYKILKPNGQMVIRSTVRTMDPTDTTALAALREFDLALHQVLGCPEAVAPVVEQDDNQYFDAEENNLLSDGLIGAEVIIARGGEQNQIARVKERKRDHRGILIGSPNTNPLLDSRLYTIEYDDGHQEDYAYNAIIEALYSQCDADGNKYYTMNGIVGHTRDVKAGRGKTKGW